MSEEKRNLVDGGSRVVESRTSGCGGDMVADGASDLEGDLLQGIGAEDLEALKTGDFGDSVGVEEVSALAEPHWLFDTQHLFDRVKAMGCLVKDRSELVPRCVHAKPGVGHVMFSVNTGEAFAEARVELSNATHPLGEDFVWDWKTLFSVIRNSGSKVAVRTRNGAPYVSVLGGDVEMESFNLDRSLFHNAGVSTREGATRVDGPLFHKFVVRAMGSMALATRPEDRRVRVEDGVGYSNFLASIFVQTGLSVQNLSLRSGDLVFLARMLESAPEFWFRETDREFLFMSPTASAALPKIDTLDLASVKGQVLKKLAAKAQFSVSPQHLYKVVSLVRQMVGNSGVVKLTCGGNKLTLKATTKSGRQLQFPISTAPDGLVHEVGIPISSLSSASLLFRADPSVSVVVDMEDRMVFNGEGMQIIFGSPMG